MIVASMHLVTCTRPDLAFSVSYVSRFTSHPLKRHDTAVKGVCSYLARPHSRSLTYKRSTTSVPLSIVAPSGSDCAAWRNTRPSVYRYAFMLNGCATSWLSKTQQSVATSTTQAEYMALATTSGEAV